MKTHPFITNVVTIVQGCSHFFCWILIDFPWFFHPSFTNISVVSFPPDLGVRQGELGRDLPQLRCGAGGKVLAQGQRGHERQEVLDLHLGQPALQQIPWVGFSSRSLMGRCKRVANVVNHIVVNGGECGEKYVAIQLSIHGDMRFESLANVANLKKC